MSFLTNCERKLNNCHIPKLSPFLIFVGSSLLRTGHILCFFPSYDFKMCMREQFLLCNFLLVSLRAILVMQKVAPNFKLKSKQNEMKHRLEIMLSACRIFRLGVHLFDCRFCRIGLPGPEFYHACTLLGKVCVVDLWFSW